ncbi:amidohydrolase [Brevibacterium sp. 5221]|uniref:Amidohydrolase n=1 Tax=Brevibacterium rongguiense TaxID=2695267 RepID=A0A6N9H4T3_9MICO|nr:M20 family metallopeptidase [Brevibacterium rongguiense]MYM18682.1 amidohydrolase [Brevibacterium rongguiense]
MSLPSAQDAAALLPRLQTIRRNIHAHPEVGLDLPGTQARIEAALSGLEVEVHRGAGLSSLTVVLRGGRRDPERPVAVLLRGDMDGLPVTEATGFEFAATNGNMHACGHDLHVTGLIGAVHLLHAARAELAGDVVFMFQPGEEGFDGAGKMLAEGVLEAAGSPVIAAYGVHVSADQALGHAYSRPGPLMAAFSKMAVTVRGRGGHAARPAQALDPIQAGAAVVGQLQEYVSRRFEAFDPVVVTVGEFHAGTAANVIPDEAFLNVGIRTFTQETTERAVVELPRLVRAIVTGHGLDADIDCETVLPPTVNDGAEAEFYLETFADLYGAQRTHRMEHPRTGSEDFSRVLMAVPGAYGHIGAAFESEPEAAAAHEVNHSPRARHSDEALGDQARFLAHLAARRLERAAREEARAAPGDVRPEGERA